MGCAWLASSFGGGRSTELCEEEAVRTVKDGLLLWTPIAIVGDEAVRVEAVQQAAN